MGIYYILPTQPYLRTLLEFIVNKYYKLDQVKIVFPNKILCESFRAIIINNSIQLPPKIITFNEFSALDASNALISIHEQKILFAKFITSYKNFNLNFNQALEISNQLVELFYEIYVEEIDIHESIRKLQNLKYAKHWQIISNLILEVYEYWQKFLIQHQKIDYIGYTNLVLDNLITKIKKENIATPIFIIGMAFKGKKFISFVKEFIKLDNKYIILPPIHKDFLSQNIDLFKNIKIFDILPMQHINSDNRIIDLYEMNTNIKTIVVDNEFAEVRTISTLINDIIHTDIALNKKIVIVTNNISLVDMCESNLLKHNIIINNLLSRSIKNCKSIEFILLLSNIYDENFPVSKLLNILKHQYILNYEYCNIEGILQKVSVDTNLRNVLHLLIDISEPEKCIIECIKIILNLSQQKEVNFTDLLKINIETAEKICPKIWDQQKEIYEILNRIVHSSYRVGVIDIKDYSKILKQFFSIHDYVNKFNPDSCVFAIKPSDAIFFDSDYIIIADCRDDTWPSTTSENIWLSNKIRQIINLPTLSNQINLEWYYFFVLLSRKNVFITRSSKIKNKLTTDSRFLIKLITLVSKHSISTYQKRFENINSKNIINSQDKEFVIDYQNKFPTSISATNLELLIRDPYGFYIKNILNIPRNKNLILESSSLQFGIFLHEAISNYTNAYQNNNKYQNLLDISLKILQKYNIKFHKFFMCKFRAIAKEFINFDEERRIKIQKIYSEVHGKFSIFIKNKQYFITAIADRIEIDNKGNMSILDYKTGVLPTSKEINSGIACQLIIEALIAFNGGFRNIPAIIPTELVYVKTLSHNPYWNIKKIEIDKNELVAHYQGLLKLIEYYILLGKYKSNTLLSATNIIFNEYKHLARNQD